MRHEHHTVGHHADKSERHHIGHHRGRYPHERQWVPRAGTEPLTARSDLPLRLLLSRIFVPVFTVAALVFVILAATASRSQGLHPTAYVVSAVICGVLAVVAWIDLRVVLKRRRQERELRDPRTSGPDLPIR